MSKEKLGMIALTEILDRHRKELQPFGNNTIIIAEAHLTEDELDEASEAMSEVRGPDGKEGIPSPNAIAIGSNCLGDSQFVRKVARNLLESAGITLIDFVAHELTEDLMDGKTRVTKQRDLNIDEDEE